MYLIIYENTFCILYDRCLYACWIDLFIDSFLFSILDCSRCFLVRADTVQTAVSVLGCTFGPNSRTAANKSARNVTVTLLSETFCTPKRTISPQPTTRAGKASPKAAENGV